MRSFLVAICFSVFLASCATAYIGMTPLGGVKGEWVDEETLDLWSLTNGFTSEQRTYEMLLLRAAEKGSERDFKFFVLQDSNMEMLENMVGGQTMAFSTKSGNNLNATAKMYNSMPDFVADEAVVFEIDKLISELAPIYKKNKS